MGIKEVFGKKKKKEVMEEPPKPEEEPTAVENLDKEGEGEEFPLYAQEDFIGANDALFKAEICNQLRLLNRNLVIQNSLIAQALKEEK